MSSGRIAVTGAAGFIGRWVVAELLDRGFVVRGIDDFSNGSWANIESFAGKPTVSIHDGDIRDSAALDSVIDTDIDACIHLAAAIDVHESLQNPAKHIETNVLGTYNVLEACRTADVRVGIVGTCMVYDRLDGDSGDTELSAIGENSGVNETHPVNPASPYAGTKLAAENLADSYYEGYGLPVTLLRPFNTYGPYQHPGTQGGVVPVFVDRDLRGGPIEIYGDGTQTRDLLYVTDCARFIASAVTTDAAVGEVINAGTGSEVSITELAQRIASEGTDIKHVEHHHPQSDVQRLRCDPQRAHTLLGWEPTVSLDDGIKAVRQWLATQEAETCR